MNNFDMKQMIKIKEKAYIELLEQKREMEALQEDLKDVIKTAEELEGIFSEEELTEELREKQEAIKKSKEIAVAFEELNNKIEAYEKNNIKDQISFLHTNYKMHELRDNLREIELLSSEYSSKYGSTGIKDVLNPDGKKKKVHEDFIETYNMYLSKLENLEGKKILNDYARIEGYAYAPIKANQPLNEQQRQLINDADNIELHEQEEQEKNEIKDSEERKDKLDELINKTEIRLQEIVNSIYVPKHGKTCVVKYNGKSVKIPRSQRGNYAKLVGDLRKYNAEKCELKNTKIDEKSYELIIPQEVVPVEEVKPVEVVKQDDFKSPTIISVPEKTEEKLHKLTDDEVEILPIENIIRNKATMRDKIKNASKGIAAAMIIIVIISSRKYKYTDVHTKDDVVYDSSFINNDTPKIAKQLDETITTKNDEPKLLANPDSVDKEKMRKERLKKMAQEYTMSSKKLDAIENNGYYVQEEGGKTK